MPEIIFVRVHEVDAITQILRDAADLASAHDVGTPEWIATFNKAVDLLSERLPIVPQMNMANFPFDIPNLKA